MSGPPDVPAIRPETHAAARSGILDRLVSALVREGLLEAGELPVRQVNAAGRLVLGSAEDPVAFLDSLLDQGLLPGGGLAWGVLRAEVAASVEGYALALGEEACRAERLAAGGRWDRGHPFTALLERLSAGSTAASPLTALEQLVVDGHPLHPGAKIRLGMSQAEVVRYAPEFGAAFPLRFVAVRREAASGADGRGGADPTDPAAGLAAIDQVLSGSLPATVRAARDELSASGRDPADHVLIPVHPHQFVHALPTLHGDALAAGVVVPLAATVRARPLMSTRTLAVREPGSPGLHIKTALEVQLTNAVRGVSPEATHNGPRLSVLLARIAQLDPAVRRLGIGRELAGVSHISRQEDAAHRRSLGAVLREDPEAGLGPGEVALPVASLLARSPLSGRALIHDVLTESGHTAERWLRLHLEPLLEPLFTLLTRYGVALEPHPQNTVLVLRDASPAGAVIRDFGGARLLASRLERQGLAVTLLPGSGLHARDAQALRSKLFFPLFGNHLAELLPALAEAGGCHEQELWAVVREEAARAFVRLAATDDGAVDDARALLADPWQLKALVRMRLSGAVTDQAYVAAPNPLGEPLNALEEGVLGELRAHDPQLAVEWLAQLLGARRDTVHDVRAALAREGQPVSEHLDGLPGGFRTELRDSAANRALSRAAVARWPHRPSLTSPHASPSAVALDLEASDTEGHPLHPCRRTRLGFSVADVLAYTPEFRPVVGVELAAVRRDLLLETPHETGSLGDIVAAAYPDVAGRAVDGLRGRGLPPDDYALVPVHPWQARVVMPTVYAPELASGGVVRLPGAVLGCRPTAAIRTLVTVDPGSDGRRLSLKLALDIQLTSARRSISPATTRNSPRLAGLLDDLLDAEPQVRHRVAFVPELAGAAFAPPEPDATAARLRGLSALVRADPADLLHPGETAVSGCALLACSPLTGAALLTELVDRAGGRPVAFLREYAELLCSAALPLLWRYGIALEAHLQNTLLVVDRAGRPARLLLRDSGGLRLHRGRMRAAGVDFTAHPGSVTVCDDLEVVRGKLAHAVLHANLGVLVAHLSRHCALSAAELWGTVREVILRVRDGDGGRTAVEDTAALLGPYLPQKALATMRLHPDLGDIYRLQPNPLFAADS